MNWVLTPILLFFYFLFLEIHILLLLNPQFFNFLFFFIPHIFLKYWVDSLKSFCTVFLLVIVEVPQHIKEVTDFHCVLILYFSVTRNVITSFLNSSKSSLLKQCLNYRLFNLNLWLLLPRLFFLTSSSEISFLVTKAKSNISLTLRISGCNLSEL